MKKTQTMLILILAGAVTFTLALWMYSTKAEIQPLMLWVAVFVVIVVLFSFLIGIKRLKDQKKGLAVDDELSLRIKERAAAIAFTFSLIMWSFLIPVFSNDAVNPRHVVEGGIVGMGAIFLLIWLYISKRGPF